MLPPVHKVDHAVVFVHQSDLAWDKDRIEYELAVIEGRIKAEPARPVPEGKRADHPWVRFVNGESRGDLATAAEYLKAQDGDDGPTKFAFERLPLDKWSTVKNLRDGGLGYEAKVFALRNSLTSATGIDLQGPKDGAPLTVADANLLRSTVGDDVYEDLGAFAISASRELAPLEKKR